jgi:hypothetical protein
VEHAALSSSRTTHILVPSDCAVQKKYDAGQSASLAHGVAHVAPYSTLVVGIPRYVSEVRQSPGPHSVRVVVGVWQPGPHSGRDVVTSVSPSQEL